LISLFSCFDNFLRVFFFITATAIPLSILYFD